MDPERQREHEANEKLRKIGPAAIHEVDWEDTLTARELLQAYNASLQRGQRVELGNRVEASIEYSVFIDEWDNKHVVTQPLGAKGQRISELVLDMDGNVLRLSLERFSGPVLELDHYMGVGLTEFNDHELQQTPGYGLQFTRYHRHGPFLVGVEQVRRRFDPAKNRVLDEQEFTLS